MSVRAVRREISSAKPVDVCCRARTRLG
jgi:hypothetical protein